MGVLDIGDIHDGDQDAISYRNELVFLIFATSIINGDKFNGKFL